MKKKGDIERPENLTKPLRTPWFMSNSFEVKVCKKPSKDWPYLDIIRMSTTGGKHYDPKRNVQIPFYFWRMFASKEGNIIRATLAHYFKANEEMKEKYFALKKMKGKRKKVVK